jgi:hypothetical protein
VWARGTKLIDLLVQRLANLPGGVAPTVHELGIDSEFSVPARLMGTKSLLNS